MNRMAALLLGVALSLGMPITAGGAESRGADAALKASRLDPVSLERRLQSVGTLLESSSAAQQIKGNGSEEGRRQAREMHEKAWEAYRAGDYAKASDLLGQTTRLLFTATRQAHPEEVAAKKKQQDFASRLKSAKALLEAQLRVSKEKAAEKEEAGHIAQAEKLLKQAEGLAASDIDKARILLEQAYVIAKSSVGKMRQGDTLVRSLQFASKAEEYRYELDRYDAHRILVDMLTQEKQDVPTVSKKIQDLVGSAARYKDKAAARAAADDHKEAVELMEEATQELIRAIRAAGIFIPG